MCICITESFCCTAEIKHNIVNQLYFNKVNLKKDSFMSFHGLTALFLFCFVYLFIYLFIFSAEWYSIVLDVPQFRHSSTEGHLGCFQVLAIMNKAAIHICVQVFVWTKFSTPLGKYQGIRLLDPIVRVCLVFSETAKLMKLPKYLYHLHSHQQCMRVLLLHNVTSSIWCCQCSRFWPF